MQPTMKAAIKPTAIAVKPTGDSASPGAAPSTFTRSRSAWPRMGITTMKNENWATRSRLSPSRIPVAIVEPDRLRPGRTATAWAIPIINASDHVMSRPSRRVAIRGRVRKKYANESRAAVTHRQIPTSVRLFPPSAETPKNAST